MNTIHRHNPFYRPRHGGLYRTFGLICVILVFVWLIREMQTGRIVSPFVPPPTPTRSGQSFSEEGQALFTAGQLDDAIAAYQDAVTVDPSNGEIWAELARIQAYSASLLTTDVEQRQRLLEALDSATKATEASPDSSETHAIRAFVLDWNANSTLFGVEVAQDNLIAAEQEAVRALQLDNTNTLALAFYAEILVDQQKWAQAEQNIKQAVEQDPGLMDVHRVYAYVLEALGQYNQAIQEYDKAIAITPNLTYLYLRAGANYRRLGFGAGNPESQAQLFEKSLEYFARAVEINKQLGVRDPTPYLSISKTYSQMGEYFSAALNVEKALEFNPSSADIYGQLGIIYFKSRNYEGSIPVLKCAVRGCTAEESCAARGGCASGDTGVAVTGLELSPNTVVYYYTYGSVLAALSRPKDNKCPEALDVLAEVKAAYSGDPDILAIVRAGEEICQSLGGP
jgi:tetratricopeptide (TPR) repeat protein